MKLFDELNDDNFELFAIRSYYNPTAVDAEEFYDDLKRFKYVKRLLTRYRENGKPPVNLLLNHLVIIFNVFGAENGLKMLEYKVMTPENLSVLKPFLLYLKVIDNHKYIDTPMDNLIVTGLREL